MTRAPLALTGGALISCSKTDTCLLSLRALEGFWSLRERFGRAMTYDFVQHTRERERWRANQMSKADLERALAGFDEAFEHRLLDRIIGAIVDASLVDYGDGKPVLALRLGETAQALTTALAVRWPCRQRQRTERCHQTNIPAFPPQAAGAGGLTPGAIRACTTS